MANWIPLCCFWVCIYHRINIFLFLFGSDVLKHSYNWSGNAFWLGCADTVSILSNLDLNTTICSSNKAKEKQGAHSRKKETGMNTLSLKEHYESKAFKKRNEKKTM